VFASLLTLPAKGGQVMCPSVPHSSSLPTAGRRTAYPSGNPMKRDETIHLFNVSNPRRFAHKLDPWYLIHHLVGKLGNISLGNTPSCTNLDSVALNGS
jgi:hypothetical protein